MSEDSLSVVASFFERISRGEHNNQDVVIAAGTGLVIGIYLFRILPYLFIPRGLASLLATLFIGILLGLLTAFALIILFFYKITRHSTEKIDPHELSTLPGKKVDTNPRSSQPAIDVTVPTPTMPHAYAVDGRLQGIIFTITQSHWSREQCVLDWPPSRSVHPAFKTWRALLHQGTLVLTPFVPPSPNSNPHHHHHHHHKHRQTTTTTIDTSSVETQQKVGIPLEGCTVELVTDGLAGRSEMVRRAPLLLTHPSWPLLDSDNGIYIFATDPAAKQQWLNALSQWCVGGEELRSVDASYAAFCLSMQQHSLLPTIVDERRGGGGGGGGEGGLRNENEKGGDGQERLQVRNKKPMWGRKWKHGTDKSNKNNPDPPPSAAAIQDIESIIEARWMQSGRVIPRPPPALPSPSRAATTPSGMAQPSGSATPMAPPVNVRPTGPTAASSSSFAVPQREAREGGSDDNCPHDYKNDTNLDSNNSMEGSRKKFNDNYKTSMPPQSVPPNAASFPHPLLSADFFINSAATRISFDLIRNPAFAEHVRARIQRSIARMHTPDYVQSLEVIAVDPGVTAPSFAHFRSVPQPTSTCAYPQLVFDMSYSGSFSVTISCKVDIRDAPAWSAIDSLIDRVEGRKHVEKRKAREAAENAALPLTLHSDDETSSSFSESDGETESILLGRDSMYRDGAKGMISRLDDDNNELGDCDVGASHSGSSAQIIQPSHPKRYLFSQLRQHTARKLRKLADNTAKRILKIPIKVTLTFSSLNGTMAVWIPPPPGDRLFWSFLTPPKLTLKAKPQIGPRLLKYAYHASQASAWIQARMELSFRKNMVFPSGGDVPLPLLLPVSNPRAADTIPDKRMNNSSARNNDGEHSPPPFFEFNLHGAATRS